MDDLLARLSVWLVAAFLAIIAMALANGTAFSIHMGIVCVAALVAMIVSMNKFDFLTQRFPALSGPALASHMTTIRCAGVRLRHCSGG